MEFFHTQTHIDFMKISKWAGLASILLTILSLVFIVTKGINFGLDFTGGTQLELRYSNTVSLEDIRQQLEKSGFVGAKVTQYGSTRDILVKLTNKTKISEAELGAAVLNALKTQDPQIQLQRVEFVGAEVGERLAEQGGIAVFIALIATLIEIALRFEYRFGVSATIALLHDPILILGIFALFQIDFDLATLAAILAVIGYSINDTVVVFDRVRENFRKVRKGTPAEIMNLSINQTLSRTIMTSAMTLLVVIALYFFGGESLHGFSLALIIGIVIGTYSSIFVAGALALKMGLTRADLLPTSKQTLDELP